MHDVRSSRLDSGSAVLSREASTSGQGLRSSSVRASADGQKSTISTASAAEQDESTFSCLQVITEKVCALWTACYEAVSPSITAFSNWVSNLFTGANPESDEVLSSSGIVKEESAWQGPESTRLQRAFATFFEFVRSNCHERTVVSLVPVTETSEADRLAPEADLSVEADRLAPEADLSEAADRLAPVVAALLAAAGLAAEDGEQKD